MAADEDGIVQPPDGGVRRWWIVVLAALLLVAVVVAATLWILMRQQASELAAATTTAVAEDPAALYFPLKPPIVVNFESEGRVRFLQADVTIMSRDPAVIAGVQTHLPLIRNRLVLMFGGEVYSELQSHEGRELLRQKALQAIDEILSQEIGKGGVEQVLFTSFVMQ